MICPFVPFCMFRRPGRGTIIRISVESARGAGRELSRAWFDSLSVLVTRGRAKVSAAAAASDWPKRIRDMQYIDVDDSD